MDIFQSDGDTLYMDGVNLPALAAEYGTPLYVLSRTAIEDKIEELKRDFVGAYPNVRVAYASKAFLCVAMAQIIDKAGFSLDVVSGGELYTAIKARFPAERIEFHGNNKTGEELALALRYGVGSVIVDAPGELEMVEEILALLGKPYKPNILFRINPSVETNTHKHISTGMKDSKFGFVYDGKELYDLIGKAIASDAVRCAGIHFHIGSQLFTAEGHMDALAKALDVMRNVKRRFGYDLPEINIGGGFGIRYTQYDDPKPYAFYLNPVMRDVSLYCAKNGLVEPCVVVEPGRSMVGEAGVTLYTIGSVRDVPGVRKFIAVDGGMSDNIRPALYGAKYVAMIANKAGRDIDDLDRVTVVGKCCETGDRLIEDALLAEVESGDILAVFSTGAYGYSMANNYNKLTIPAVVMVENGKAKPIVRRQTYEDIVDRDLPL